MASNVLITGANRGIGAAILTKYAENGYNVVACARKKSEEFENEIKEKEQKYHVRIWTAYFDLENEEEVKTELKRIILEVKKIDVLVNNAGISTATLFPMLTSKNLKKEMQINYITPILIAQILSRVMGKQGGGSIINIASVSGMRSEVGRISYGGSKAALIYASKTMSIELAKDNIRVNCVSPGFIDTDMWKKRDTKLRDKVLEETPIGRQGMAEDVANVVYYLSSENASYITGQNIVVDGGRMI